MPTTVPGTGTANRGGVRTANPKSARVPIPSPSVSDRDYLSIAVLHGAADEVTYEADAPLVVPRSYDAQLGFDIPAVHDGPIYRWSKRLTDLVLGVVALAILSPVMLIAAVLVKLQDGGPIFFSQRRVGRGGRLFSCYKFRTMVVNADALKHTVLELNHHQDHRTFKVKRDPRVTRVGYWLRRLSVDEFPQLLNVLQGEMSLVGPRPPVPGEVALYTDIDMKRLEVKPGLTCLWQIGGRGDLPFDQQIVLDLEYIEKRGFLFDLLLIFRTVPVLVTAKGAY